MKHLTHCRVALYTPKTEVMAPCRLACFGALPHFGGCTDAHGAQSPSVASVYTTGELHAVCECKHPHKCVAPVATTLARIRSAVVDARLQ